MSARRLLLVAALAACAPASRAPTAPATAATEAAIDAPGFDAALADHLAKIRARDLPGLLATVADDVTLILPNGKLLEGAAAFRAFHVEWFAETTWTMEFRELRRVATPAATTVLLQTDYRDVDAAGAPVHSQSYLAMTFRRVGDRWLLSHDQNTRLPAPAPAP